MKLVNQSPDPVALSTLAVGDAFSHNGTVCLKTDAVDGGGDLGCVDLATGAFTYMSPATSVSLTTAEIHYL